MREILEHESTVAFFSTWALCLPFDLRPRGLDEFSVVHAGRARGHAGHTAEAAIEVADPIRIHIRGAFAGEFHQVDAAARGIHFLTPQNVSGARGQTKPAMDALFDDFVGRWMVCVKGAGEGLF